MKNTPLSHSHIMKEAWRLARYGAKMFGGSVKLYFATALRITWQENKTKPAVVWHKGLGNQFLMPGLPMPAQVNKKNQFVLPGIVN